MTPNQALQDRRAQAENIDPKVLQKRQAAGTLHARARIESLVDADSFLEIDRYARHQCRDFGMEQKVVDGGLAGDDSVTIDGRPVYIFAHDATFVGGALGEVFARKVCKIMDLAAQAGVPVVGLNESGGARIQEGVRSLAGYADIFYRNVSCSGVIPQISVIYGACAGGAVYSPAVTDFTIMVKDKSFMFVTGPEIVRTVTGEEVTLERLGGATTHNTLSGVAQLLAEDEEHSFYLTAKLLSYLPSNNMVDAPLDLDLATQAPADADLLDSIVPTDPTKPYDIKAVIEKIVDAGDFFEISPHFAQNIVTGFARLGGRSIGIIANQPRHMAGCLDINASVKAARFVRFLDAFNIPILTFVDVPGYLPGTKQEFDGIIRHGAKLLYAYCEASVPKLTVITRKAYGGAFDVMGSKNVGGDFNFAWPTAEIAVVGAEAAVNLLYRKELKENPDSHKELVAQYRDRFANPYIAAQEGYVDDVIMPSETRHKLIQALKVQSNKSIELPKRKHGNIPL